MKNLLTILFLFSATYLFSQAGGLTCPDMEPICTDAGVSFQANANGPDATVSEPGNNYDCLLSAPNPSWFYLEISAAGNIIMNLSAPTDVDFVIWGPYPNLATAQATCGNHQNVVPGTNCDWLGICDGEGCSFSTAATETPGIPNAQVGQVYVMLVTNYANNVQNITLTQTGGTGATDCTILQPECLISFFEANISACINGTGSYDVTGVIEYEDAPTTGNLIVQDCFGTQHIVASAPFPAGGVVNYTIPGLPANGAACSLTTFFSADPTCQNGPLNYTAPTCDCSFTNIEANISACDPNDNTFSVSGLVEFINPPTTGQLIIEDCNGNQQVFNAPFTSPINYNLAGLNSNGTLNCELTATFTANAACNISVGPYNNPANCTCDADAGTFTDGVVGDANSTNPWLLCFGDELDIIGNGDFSVTENPLIAAIYDPGIWLLVYDCPPTIAPPGLINDDPCLLGVASTADQAWTIVNNSGDGATLYFVPLTMYSMVDGIYAISLNGGNWCYDLGPTYPVTFLPEVTTAQVQDCQAGTATVTVNGGVPAINGSSFTASNLSPASAAFGNTTASNGGTIAITGLVDGDAWSFDIIDNNGCPITVSGTFIGVEDPAFTYPNDTYCQDELNPSPIVTGDPGGTFTAAPVGLSINPASGLINLAASTPGTYTVTYTTPDPICFDQATFVITINPVPVIDPIANVTNCLEYILPAITGTNLTGNQSFYTGPGGTGTALAPGAVINTVGTTTIYVYDQTGTVPNCVDEISFTVTILPAIQDMTCPPALTAVCSITEQPAYASYNAFITAGGSVTLPAGAVVDPTTFNLVSQVSDGLSCPETFTRTYAVTDECGITVSCEQIIIVNDIVNPSGNAPANVTVQCAADVPAVNINSLIGVSDNCGAPVVTHVGDVTNGLTCPEIITRTYRIEDACGNFIEVDQIITIDDDTNPIGNAPANIAIQCAADIPAVDINSLIGVSDNCSVPVVTHVGDATNGQTCPEVITRTYRIEDACGNFIEVDQIITINDDTNPSASNPAPITVECATDVPAPNISVVIDEADNCTIAPIVEFVSDVTDNNVCNGEVITRTYSVTDDCGNSINVVQTITIDSYTPTFTLSFTDPTECGVNDGTITVSGLDPNTTYAFTYNGNPTQNITTDVNGEYTITDLPAGSYSVFTVSDADCPACSSTDNTSLNLVAPNAPPINAGPDQQVCEGTQVTLTAINPDGATITWNNGVTDAVAFTPAVGSLNYTVTAEISGCFSTDVVSVTVYAVPVIDPIADVTECDSYTLPVITGTNLTGNQAFFTAPNGGGTQLSPGNVITTAGTTTIYAYDETGTTPNCFDETSFVVTINLTPELTPVPNVQICDEFTLAAINGINLTGNQAYYTAPNGGGTQLNPGDIINTAGANTIYVYDQTSTVPNCLDETSFVVTINLTPIIDPIANATECDSYTLPAISGTNLTGNQAYYTAPNGGGTQLNPGDLITAAGANTIYIYDATATTPNCFDETSFVVTINVTPNLNPVANVIACDQFIFGAIQGVNLTGNQAYYSAPNGGGTEYNPGNVFTTPGLSTIYVFDQTATVPNCFDEVSFTINISITPNFTLSSTNPTECAANDGTITLSGLMPGETYTIGYTSNGTPVGPINLTANGSGEVIITGLTAGSYANFVVELNDCIGSSNTIIALVDPNAPALNAGPDIQVCEGEQITLTAVNPEGAVISWNNGVNDGVPFNQAVGTVTYTVTANLDNCISTDQVVVTVHPTPNVFAGNDFTTCAGQSAILTGTGAQTYSWTNGVMNGVSFTPTQTQTYTVTGTSQFGCVATDEVTVTVEELPTPSFEGDNLEGCTPVTTTFTNTSATALGSECVWYLSNGTVLVGCDNVAYTFTNPGCYDVTLEITSANGCSNSTTIEDYVCVQAYPVAYFTFSPNLPTTINTTISFTNGSIGASNYQWFFGDGATSNAIDPTHTYPEIEGSYVVTLVASTPFGCTDTVRSIINVVEELIFYVPNTFTPDGDDFNETFQPVFTSGYDPFDFHLMIFNRWGELIFESYDASIGWDGTYGGKANGGELVKDGTYVWKIEVKTKLNDERKMFVGHVNVLK